MSTETATHDIIVKNMCKDFVLRHNRATTMKTKIVGLFNRKIRESRSTLRALDDISFKIPHGKSLGLMGHNGSGKSTLLRLLAGIYRPTSGTISVPKDKYIGTMIALGVGFSPQLTGLENIYLNASLYGYPREQVSRNIDRIIEFAELSDFMDVLVKNYSSGMMARLGFSVMIIMDMDILLIDEVFGTGDLAFKEKSKARMMEFKKTGKTIVFVSHSPAYLSEFCDYVCLLDHGRMAGIGSPEEVNDLYVALTKKKVTFEEVKEKLGVPEEFRT